MNTHATTHPASTPRRSRVQRLLRALVQYRQRQHLGKLDAHMLRDIGMTAAQAQAEAARPIWDAPASWVTTRR